MINPTFVCAIVITLAVAWVCATMAATLVMIWVAVHLAEAGKKIKVIQWAIEHPEESAARKT